MHSPPVVDNYDWLKAAAITFVAIGHFGYFFVDDAAWWSVFGRMAAPVFFFLMGYARSRTIPLRWLWLGLILTLLDSWNTDWAWVAPNILFSMVLIRLARPAVKSGLERFGSLAFGGLECGLLVLLPFAGEMVDYGAEGWMWALFGLLQRMHVDGSPTAGSPIPSTARKIDSMRLLACFVAAIVYLWQEQLEFEFSRVQFAAVSAGLAALSASLYWFWRGPSPIQPPAKMAQALHYMGTHTLEIYAIQLAGSELLIHWLPDLAP